MIRVAVLGALGRMGDQVCRAVDATDDLELVAAIDAAATGAESVCGLEVASAIAEAAAAGAEVAVDFTHPDVVEANIDELVESGIHVVVGTSGFDAARLAELEDRLAAVGSPHVLVAPNMAIGGVLMMYFAEKAAPFFDRAEIIELHHDAKADSPSGTAQNTAERMQTAREAAGGWPERGESTETVAGSRGGKVGDVRVHAVRLPGLVAHQEVILGTQGQTLTIRHDSHDRTSFMPGVLLAVRGVVDRPGLTVGLEPLLGLV